jgi:acetate kinase
MNILVLNAGSSSHKSCLYQITTDRLPALPPEPIWSATIDITGQPNTATMTVKTSTHQNWQTEIEAEPTTAIPEMLKTLWSGNTQVINNLQEIDVVGHRVVHGGELYHESTIVTPEVKDAIARLSLLAPSHNPANLAGIRAVETALGTVPQVAVFDTAFHHQIPDSAAIYPGPYEWVENGIRRYGFHGISHQYCAQRAAEILERDLTNLRLITCHLGNGCSLAAIKNGYSIDTTMGFTPLDGLMMGSRSGSIDPGILLYLMRESGYSSDRLDTILNRESGLKGISGISSDLRQVVAEKELGNSRAQLAWDIYIHRLRSGIGAMMASLKGVDAIVFTGGVGENSAAVRTSVCQGFEWLGWQLDADKNENKLVDIDIATMNSTARILVIHTQEDWAIAQECWRLIQGLGISSI